MEGLPAGSPSRFDHDVAMRVRPKVRLILRRDA
jgi:hypothetical protein